MQRRMYVEGNVREVFKLVDYLDMNEEDIAKAYTNDPHGVDFSYMITRAVRVSVHAADSVVALVQWEYLFRILQIRLHVRLRGTDAELRKTILQAMPDVSEWRARPAGAELVIVDGRPASGVKLCGDRIWGEAERVFELSIRVYRVTHGIACGVVRASPMDLPIRMHQAVAELVHAGLCDEADWAICFGILKQTAIDWIVSSDTVTDREGCIGRLQSCEPRPAYWEEHFNAIAGSMRYGI